MQGNTITNLLVIERYMGVNNNIKMLAAVINVNGKHDDVHLKQGLVCQIMSLKTPIIKYIKTAAQALSLSIEGQALLAFLENEGK